MIKSSIRKSILKRRLALSEANLASLSSTIQTRLIESDYFIGAKSVAVYSPINNEVETDKIIAACFEMNKKIFLPKLCSTDLNFLALKPDSQFQKNKFGIPEICNSEAEIAGHIDLMICPGIAFDSKKNRVGYGGGYYDRYLTSASYKHLGMLGFSMQKTESISVDSFDIPMDFILTENGFLN
jgi:5-formyltetrahydrofolate cyclo-ligase